MQTGVSGQRLVVPRTNDLEAREIVGGWRSLRPDVARSASLPPKPVVLITCTCVLRVFMFTVKCQCCTVFNLEYKII